jgi:hypothetical protein
MPLDGGDGIGDVFGELDSAIGTARVTEPAFANPNVIWMVVPG